MNMFEKLQQIKKLGPMSDGDLEKLLHALLGRGAGLVPTYCESWAATGPLMVKHGVWPISNNGHQFAGLIRPIIHTNWEIVYENIIFNNHNPLRAVVECLILVLQEDDQ